MGSTAAPRRGRRDGLGRDFGRLGDLDHAETTSAVVAAALPASITATTGAAEKRAALDAGAAHVLAIAEQRALVDNVVRLCQEIS